MSQTFTINKQDYPIAGYIKDSASGQAFPVLNIPPMSDQRWNELSCSQQKVEATA